MGLFYNKTVTIFNQAHSEDVLGDEIWYVTVLENVRVQETKGANITATGLIDADSAKLHIDTNTLNKKYCGPAEWDNLLDKSEAFTLRSDRDFFVVGDASEAEPGLDDMFDYMEKNFDGVYRITSVDKYELIPHLEVGGK